MFLISEILSAANLLANILFWQLTENSNLKNIFQL